MELRPQCSTMVTGSMHEEPPRERARAIVSPDSGEMVLTVPGNAPPVAVAPAYAELNRFWRPCTSGVAPGVAAWRTWQPLHDRTSPGRTLSHERCGGLARRPSASRIEIWNATLAGTFMRTDPSGSTGAYATISRITPVGPNAELSGSAMSSSSGIDTGFSMRTKRAWRWTYCALAGFDTFAIEVAVPLLVRAWSTPMTS